MISTTFQKDLFCGEIRRNGKVLRQIRRLVQEYRLKMIGAWTKGAEETKKSGLNDVYFGGRTNFH